MMKTFLLIVPFYLFILITEISAVSIAFTLSQQLPIRLKEKVMFTCKIFKRTNEVFQVDIFRNGGRISMNCDVFDDKRFMISCINNMEFNLTIKELDWVDKGRWYCSYFIKNKTDIYVKEKKNFDLDIYAPSNVSISITRKPDSFTMEHGTIYQLNGRGSKLNPYDLRRDVLVNIVCKSECSYQVVNYLFTARNSSNFSLNLDHNSLNVRNYLCENQGNTSSSTSTLEFSCLKYKLRGLVNLTCSTFHSYYKISKIKMSVKNIFILCPSNTKKIVRSSRSTKNTNLFKLLSNSTAITLPQIVIVPKIDSENETFEIEYKSFIKKLTRIRSSQWILSVHVDQHFFYNHKLDEPLHALCFLQFSIETVITHNGEIARCKIIFSLNNIISVITNCSLLIGGSPSICSANFNLTGINFYNPFPTWASISAELYFPSFSEISIITSSINQPSFMFDSLKLFNWTVLQTSIIFGEFAIGLPVVSIKTGTRFTMPIVIDGLYELKCLKILIEYSDCFSFVGFENLEENQWEIRHEFEHSEQDEIRFILLKLHTRYGRVVKNRKEEQIALLTFFVSEEENNDECWLRAGITALESLIGGKIEYFAQKQFRKTQKQVKIPIDSQNLVMIAFSEPRTALVKSYSPYHTIERISSQVYTYYLYKSVNLYYPQLIKNVTCRSSKFSKGIAKKGCVPQNLSDSWVLSMKFQHWKTVLFNTFNIWKPESSKVFLSDYELNPIVNWFVIRNYQCAVLYQSAVLEVGTRLNTLNSFGQQTYLGSSSRDLKPWIDISKEIDIFKIKVSPSGVVSLSRNENGTILIDVIANQITNIFLHSKNKLFPDTKLTVVSDSWVSVVKFIGRCISHLDIKKIESHPSSEGQFLNYEIELRKLRRGEQCHLFLGVEFNDKTQILLENISHDDYRLEVDEKEFINGNLVTYQPKLSVILYGSSLCNKSIVGMGTIDLSSDLDFDKSQENIISNEVSEKEISSQSKMKQRNPLSIVIYSICGVVVMSLGIIFLGCVIWLNVRRQSIANKQRRISRSGNYERQNKQTDYLNSHKDHYFTLLPPPGPMIPLNEHPNDLVEHSSSLGPQQPGAALSTCRIPMANESIYLSRSSSCIRQTSPSGNNVILNEPNNMYPPESHSPQLETQLPINHPYWLSLNSNYRLPNHYQVIHDQTLTSEHSRQDHI